MNKKVDKEKITKQGTGETLRKLRTAKGLSLEEVYQKTKIHISVIQALEEEKIDNMAPAYVKGLLKVYCGTLGVDHKNFIEEQTRQPTVAHIKKEEVLEKEPTEFSKDENRSPLVKPYIDLAMIKKRLKMKPVVFVVCLFLLAITIFRVARGKAVRQGKDLKESPPVQSLAKVTPKLVNTTPVPVINNPRLGIRAKENCWVEVKVDAKTIFKNILKEGHFESWEAKERIEFSLGNAGGVEVEVNGKLVSHLGRRGQVIKNIRITKEGLTVPN